MDEQRAMTWNWEALSRLHLRLSQINFIPGGPGKSPERSARSR
jgi:hypothetical protein